MIGRGSIINPFIFHQIKAYYSGIPYKPEWNVLINYFEVYRNAVPAFIPVKTCVGKLKQLMGFFFKGNPRLQEMRQSILTSQYNDPDSFMQFALPLLQEGWR
jgi:tRNA-dihydrouridine synthase C